MIDLAVAIANHVTLMTMKARCFAACEFYSLFILHIIIFLCCITQFDNSINYTQTSSNNYCDQYKNNEYNHGSPDSQKV